ncbi:MAG: hypothetical protein GY874_01370 [Desulfobacteraceae bacterium]|nr:hypothetical protein [Desulfobacteraceae bacterium]
MRLNDTGRPENKYGPLLPIIIEVVHLLALFLSHTRNAKTARANQVLFDQLLRHFKILTNLSDHADNLIIRQIPGSSSIQRPLYLIIFGDIVISPGELAANRLKLPKHLMRSLEKAFNCFFEQGFVSIYLRIAEIKSNKKEQLRLALNIAARYQQAVENAASITFYYFGSSIAVPLVKDWDGQVDPNLTIVAGLNGLSSINIQKLIKQADAYIALKFNKEDTVLKSFERFFLIRSIRSQLIRPLIEINNITWETIEQDYDIPKVDFPVFENLPIQKKSKVPPPPPSYEHTEEPIILPTTAIVSAKNVQDRAMDSENEILFSYLFEFIQNKKSDVIRLQDVIFINDYANLDMDGLVHKIHDFSKLLLSFEKTTSDQAVYDAILTFLYKKLEYVPDRLILKLATKRRSLSIIDDEKTIIVGLIHPKVIDLLTLMKERLYTAKKIDTFNDLGLKFFDVPVEQLTEQFGLQTSEIELILQFLKKCFDAYGIFDLKEFKLGLDHLVAYASTIIEMLWSHLDKSSTKGDRLNILEAYRLLTHHTENNGHAIRFILAVVFQNPFEINYSDRSGFLLCNILMHHQEKRLGMNINRTSNKILYKKSGIDKQAQQYCSWRLKTDKMRILSKISALQDAIKQSMKIDINSVSSNLDVYYCLSMERELIIFLSLVEGQNAGFIIKKIVTHNFEVMVSAAEQKFEQRCVSKMIENILLAIYGLARTGNIDDIDTLKAFEIRIVSLRKMEMDYAHHLLLAEVINNIALAIKSINMRQ